MLLTLRDYQQDAIVAIRKAFGHGHRRVLLQLPTGAGKTVCFAHITEGAARKNRRVLILVHRRELLMQCSRALDALGVPHGLISPHHKPTTELVQVASVQTLVRRLLDVPEPDLIIVDEAHHTVAGTWLRVLEVFKSAWILGVTATPAREDGRGLGTIYQELVQGPTVAQLIRSGYLCDYRMFQPPVQADLTHLRHRAGDFDKAASAAALDRATIVGDVIGHYRKLLDGKPSLIFCASVAHAHHVAEAFQSAGYRAAALDGTTDDTARRNMIADLGDATLNILTSCDVVSEGTDIPAVHGAILLRPTESTTLYLQQIGRVLRPCEGKQRAVVLDHVGNSQRHGLPDDDRDWSLESGIQRAPSDKTVVQRMKMCQHCYAMNLRLALTCEQCGTEFEQRELPQEVAGELRELSDAERQMQRQKARNDVFRARSREQLEELARARGYKTGWVNHILRARNSHERARA